MKPRLIPLILSGITLLIGFSVGVLLQKYVGTGNVLRSIGIPYPTQQSPGNTITMPIVEIPPADQGNLYLFILAGQSNMVGWAPVPEDEKSDPRVFVFGNDYHWRIASEPVDISYNQVDKISEDRGAGFGPSLSFAYASLEYKPDIVIGLIPCAKSSSGIIEWQRNLSEQSLYGSCLKRALAASPMGQISGILFFQGEADALNPDVYFQPVPQAAEWSQLFSAMVTDFRRDLGEPDLPVVFAQLGRDPAVDDFLNWNIIKEQQAAIDLPMTAMIVTDDLPLLDGLHFTTESYRTIGKRFADRYWSLIVQHNNK